MRDGLLFSGDFPYAVTAALEYASQVIDEEKVIPRA
jgi:hypothetical protein